MDKEGFPIKSTMSSEETVEYTGLTSQLLEYMGKELVKGDIKVGCFEFFERQKKRSTLGIGSNTICEDEIEEA